MAMSNGAVDAEMEKLATATEILDKVGDHELAVIRALYENADGLDEIKLASEARLGISEALGAAIKLKELGLVELVQDNGGRPRFRLNREGLQTQVESAPDALLS